MIGLEVVEVVVVVVVVVVVIVVAVDVDPVKYPGVVDPVMYPVVVSIGSTWILLVDVVDVLPHGPS